MMSSVATSSITNMKGWRMLSKNVLRMIAEICWNMPESASTGGVGPVPGRSGIVQPSRRSQQEMRRRLLNGLFCHPEVNLGGRMVRSFGVPCSP
jgi:hypothetical protein